MFGRSITGELEAESPEKASAKAQVSDAAVVIFEGAHKNLVVPLYYKKTETRRGTLSQSVHLEFSDYLCKIPNTKSNQEKIEAARERAKEMTSFRELTGRGPTERVKEVDDDIASLEKKLKVLKQKQRAASPGRGKPKVSAGS